MGYNNQLEKPASKLRKRFIRKKWLITGIVIVVLFIAGAAGGWLYVSYSQKAQEDKIVAQESKRSAIAKQAEDDAQTIVYDGGSVNAAGAAYDSALKEASGDSRLTNTLLLSKATLYFNNKNYDEALKIALQAEAVVKDDNVEQFVAQIYESKSDMQNAIKYYQRAISLVDKSQPMADSDVKYYRSKITELGG